MYDLVATVRTAESGAARFGHRQSGRDGDGRIRRVGTAIPQQIDPNRRGQRLARGDAAPPADDGGAPGVERQKIRFRRRVASVFFLPPLFFPVILDLLPLLGGDPDEGRLVPVGHVAAAGCFAG